MILDFRFWIADWLLPGSESNIEKRATVNLKSKI
jgi:hypothetical protein